MKRSIPHSAMETFHACRQYLKDKSRVFSADVVNEASSSKLKFYRDLDDKSGEELPSPGSAKKCGVTEVLKQRGENKRLHLFKASIVINIF